ncbi:hypothetical protein BR93DRAFT_922400 [Coniochaeta sp. PMI_546]|nr:hypothetical protein BR93DRAFT_922400 [Coniochaeta sp. PMI_546]
MHVTIVKPGSSSSRHLSRPCNQRLCALAVLMNERLMSHFLLEHRIMKSALIFRLVIQIEIELFYQTCSEEDLSSYQVLSCRITLQGLRYS